MMFLYRVFLVAPVLMALAACAASPSVSSKSESLGAGRQATFERDRKASMAERYASAHADSRKTSSYGLASFYGEGLRTASGEMFNPNELTAAHPTLPFGTRLRVTNVTNGRSVVVRVNDRGPFVPGRVVDVSHSAAETLGMIGSGTAKVKVDVVQ
jgi:rare lipoprotein A